MLTGLVVRLSGGNEDGIHRNGPARQQACAVLSLERFSQRLTPLSPFGCTSDTHAGREFPHYVQAVATLRRSAGARVVLVVTMRQCRTLRSEVIRQKLVESHAVGSFHGGLALQRLARLRGEFRQALFVRR